MMNSVAPGIDQVQTGLNIKYLRVARDLSVKDVQKALNFEAPQAIYKWERGASLPSLDNLVVLADFYEVRIDDIVIRVGQKAKVCTKQNTKILTLEQQDSTCCPNHFWSTSKYTA